MADQASSEPRTTNIVARASLITAIATGVLCVLNIIYLLVLNKTVEVMLSQTDTMRDQLKEMQKNNEIQREAFVFGQRASVYIRGSELTTINPPKQDPKVRFTLEIGNSGNVTTKNLRVRTSCGFSLQNIAGFFAAPDASEFAAISISPKGTVNMDACVYKVKDAIGFSEFYIFAEAKYDDSFDMNKSRITQYCIKNYLKMSDDNKVVLGEYAQCPEPRSHSCTDDECSRLR